MMVSQISAKGQITLPRRVRQALKLKPGDRVFFLVDEISVLLQPLAAINARALAGSLQRYAGARRAGPARAAVKKGVAGAAAQEG